jgi:two-component system sensor histidine kinase/response regulator
MTLTKPHILVVDDSPDDLQLMRDLLEKDHYAATLVSDGAAALAAAHADLPDLILLDVTMPVMNGYEVCERLQADPLLKNIPVLFLSGAIEETDKIRAFRAGAVDYITKPFQLEEVAARVRAQLELSRQKRELQGNYERLRELNQLRDNLIHMIIHDLRSPLAGIEMSLDLLRERLPYGDAHAANLFNRARNCLNLLTQMIAQLLDISRLEARQMPLNRQQLNLADTARAALDSVVLFGGEFSPHLSVPEPVQAFFDPEIVRRIIENLVINAMKFSQKNCAVQITITRDGGMPRVAVSDQGPGIPSHFHQAIFEKFAQVDPEHKRVGAGLGLAFCKLAVEAHGGEIGVISEPGQGSTFWFTLPSRN